MTLRDDYASIEVFDLKDANTTGTLAIHPYVEDMNGSCIGPTEHTLAMQQPQQTTTVQQTMAVQQTSSKNINISV